MSAIAKTIAAAGISASLGLGVASAAAQSATDATPPETPATVFSDWLQLDSAIAKAPDAVVRMGFAWTAFFKGGKLQLHSSTGQSAGSVWPLSEIPDWPAGWDKVDAAFTIDDGAFVVIRGAEYLQMHFDPDTGAFLPEGKPAPLFPSDPSGGGGVFPAAWGGRIDAAVRWDMNLVMLLKGDEYILYDLSQDTVTAPVKMSAMQGWPAGWDRIDAAVNPGYGAVYFFRGSEYVTWDLNANAMVAHAPQSMLPGATLAAHIADRLVPKSHPSSAAVKMTVGNRTDQPMEVYWVDLDGKEKPYATVAPYKEYVQPTYANHLWQAKQGGAVVAQFRASADASQQFLVFAHPPGTAFLTSYEELKLDPNVWAGGRSDSILPYPNSDWLGAGFDLTLVDPADLSNVRSGANGPRRESAVLLTLSNARSADGRFLLPHGVRLKSSATTQDDDLERMISSTADLRNTFDLEISQGLDVGIGAFTRALSYSHVNDTATGSEQIYWLQRAVARHDRLSLDPTWEDGSGQWNRQRLAPDFVARVGRLGDGCGQGYDQLRDAYGTHYAKSVQFGGQYNKLTKINKSAFDRFEGNRTDFEQHLRLTVPDTPVSVSSGQKIGSGSSEARGQRDEFRDVRVFASGGEGFSDPDSWKASLRKEPVPVDILFAPYTELLNAAFFPGDPQIYDKQEKMRDCSEAYFRHAGATYKDRTTVSAAPFFVKQVPDELKKKRPDYRYVTEVLIVTAPEACTALDVAMKAARSTAGYKLVDADLNRDAIFAEHYWLCLKMDSKGKPITRIYPISHNAGSGGSSCQGNDIRLKENVNEKWNNFGQSDYICHGTDPSEYPLYDVQVRATVGSVPDYTHRPSSAGMVLNAGNVLLYLHTQDVKQAQNAGRFRSDQIDIVANIDWKQ